jgi:Na+(H+)/acetate symporter ActP
MKKPLALAILAGLAVFIIGVGFATFWVYCQARDIREYLPAQSRVAGVTVGASTVRVGGAWLAAASG